MSWSDQIGFPLLSVITFLPLAGVLLILLFASRQAGRRTRSSRSS